jgi:folate-binding protein YgfZ
MQAPPAAALVAAWQWLQVRSGVAAVCAATSDLFVPQMLNYESVGGVNFKKGCYPGQEVVARSQFRGTLKRRACLVHSHTALEPGQDVWGTDPDQPCGTVASAAPHPDGGWDAVVSVQVVATEGPGLFAGGPGASALQLLPLPYPLLDI